MFLFLLVILVTVGLDLADHFSMIKLNDFLIICISGIIIYSAFISVLEAVSEIVTAICLSLILPHIFSSNHDDSNDNTSASSETPDFDSDTNYNNSDYDENEGYENPCIGITTDKNGNRRKLYRFRYYSGDDAPKYYKDDDGNVHYVN